jgi:hypothetical protein
MNIYRKSLTKRIRLVKFVKPLAILFFIAFSYTYAAGQILNLTVPLDAGQEVPPLALPGTGTGNFTFNPLTNVLSGTVTFSGLSAPSTAGHIHTGAVGINGPVVIPIDASGGVGVTAGTMIVPPTDLAAAGLLNAFITNGTYTNIHTGNNPGGEIRGQINMPATTFVDVPATHLASAQIEATAAAGITGGCLASPLPFFCPDNSITRGQMAVFMETSLGNTAPPVCTGAMFNDVTVASVGQGFCNFIEAFANRGITGGCVADDPLTPANEAMYCPNNPVIRAQMAVFIETAIGGVIGACAGTFTDVDPQSAFCGFIERLALDQITGGCGPGIFCPNDPVTRAQMSVFLTTAPGLLPLP